MTPDCITVVIPFFQREPGVLTRALASIAAQVGCPLPVHVLVVDDASPVDPAPEIAAAVWAEGQSCQLVRRPNGGPGAARNTGLDHAPPNTRLLAFLDSDDQWHPEHLQRAVKALEHGFDFYFADHYQLGQNVGAFARAGKIDIAAHPLIDPSMPELHAYQGDLFDQVLRGNIIGTSTVVYDFRRFSDKRFRVEFTHAGEDYLFWMELITSGARSAFSSVIEATYGRGVNIYAASGWGTEEFARRVYNELRYRKTVRDGFPLNAGQREHVQREISRLREAFAEDVIHRLRNGKPVSRPLMKAQRQLDPWSVVAVPWVGLRRLLGRR